ncbi:glycosyltransferase [Synechococcus sp. CBW1107]|uniref:glycosyltransferase n=1 Tax=Synechococcus sp. CBW1107 TaxID=2789857 RepID=UPI002AD312A8|nr:glycosyltransferase [Synechococcus sp. CBW1107]
MVNEGGSQHEAGIIGYLPESSSGWILQYLFDDISSASGNKRFRRFSSLIDIFKAGIACRNSIFYALHYFVVDDLVELGIPVDSIYVFYTHSRINTGIPASLYRVRAVLPMNSTEAAMLLLAGVSPNKIRVFPAGYNPNLFGSDLLEEDASRDIDIMIACRFSRQVEEAYAPRKNYDQIVQLANELSARSKTVAIVGPGWKHAYDLLPRSTLLLEPRHEEYAKIYRRSKIFLTLSRQEGGPVSWLEAMASGCITVSSATGFPAELVSGQLDSYTMPLRSTRDEWMDILIRLLDQYKPLSKNVMNSRSSFLQPATFKNLASFLTGCLNNQEFEPCLEWPGSSVTHNQT